LSVILFSVIYLLFAIKIRLIAIKWQLAQILCTLDYLCSLYWY